MDWELILSRLNALLDAGRHNELRGALMMLNVVDILFLRFMLTGIKIKSKTYNGENTCFNFLFLVL